MIFTPTTLFRDISCPAGAACDCLNCIFKHDFLSEEERHDGVLGAAEEQQATRTRQSPDHESHPAKRRKITYDKLEDKPVSKADVIRAGLVQARTNSKGQNDANNKTTSITRPITPPSGRKNPVTNKDVTKKSVTLSAQLEGDSSESLNPRVVTPAPESHGKRVMFLQHIHSNMCRLNRSIRDSTSPVDGLDPVDLQKYVLSNQAITKFALNEEEEVARSSPQLYANLIRNRILLYKRISLDAWIKKLKSLVVQIPTTSDATSKTTPALLKIESELAALMPDQLGPYISQLSVTETESLQRHGYIFEPPDPKEVQEAQRAVELSCGFEQCDRCGSRCQVFPDRDPATGRLTSGGTCKYHWGRKYWPTGGSDAVYTCCGQLPGSHGCTECPDHVYKCTSPARLAAVMPFIKTPINHNRRYSPSGLVVSAVVFDCEMAYTTNGMELIRLTALRFIDKEPLIDVLVRPLGAIIDFNTRFSGVTPEQFRTAPAYETNAPLTPLRIVSSPAIARDLLCEYLSGDRIPLMGHAIDNDLNATRLCQRAIIDTVVLYPHNRGLPMRMGLKALTKQHLNKSIQIGGSAGHDSHEDAAATHDLILLKLAKKNDLPKAPLTQRASELMRQAIASPG